MTSHTAQKLADKNWRFWERGSSAQSAITKSCASKNGDPDSVGAAVERKR